MRLRHCRPTRAALVLAAALAATAATPPLRAEQGRVITVQSEADLKKRVDQLFQGLSAAGAKVTYGSVEKAGKDGVLIKKIEVTGPDGKKVTIEEVEIRDLDWENPQQAAKADFSIRKLVIPSESLDKGANELGLTSLTITADVAYKFDEAGKAFEIPGIFVDMVELGELKLKLKLVGISLADIKRATSGEKPPGEKKDDNAAMKLMASINLAGATISFKDKSLVERMIRSEAKKKNMTEAAAKAKMLEDLAEQRKKAEDDATRELIDHATKFLTKPGTIELVASPAQPANLMMAFMAIMSSPATLKQMLGLAITVQ